jgi:hypothetical protein
MPAVWDRTTGGVTVNGDTIVVAILDVGYQADHEDLVNNIWHNRAEIPNDNIDNDLNGYVDDYTGLNLQTGDDVHEVNFHGTAVAGIIGAEGDNGRGIAGVNWHVKLLLVSGIDKESDIIEGYMYIRALRNKYNTSGGTSGAFIVATNLSAGIDNALPADHAMWCAQYESLGNVGILGICATTNTNSDVDMFGDMPTTCPGEYLLAVTNTGMDDQKLMFAGYGKTHIDLGAPGTPTHAPHLGHGYKDFIGTSAAAPHVAGAVAILYAMACDDLTGLALTQPATVARQMKSLILGHSDPIAGLLPLTVTGGRLNVLNAVNAVDSLCGNTGGELMVLQITPNPVVDEAIAEYRIPRITTHEVLIYDATGRLILHERPTISGPGLQYFKIKAGRMVPGVYHFTVRQDKRQETISFLVQ